MYHISNKIVESGLISEIWGAVAEAREKRGDTKGADQAEVQAIWSSPEYRDTRAFRDGREATLL